MARSMALRKKMKYGGKAESKAECENDEKEAKDDKD